MVHSPAKSQSGKGAASGETKPATNEEMVRFKDLNKRLFGRLEKCPETRTGTSESRRG